MSEDNDVLLRLAADRVAIDSCSIVSNLAVAERIEAELPDFKSERLDYDDAPAWPSACWWRIAGGTGATCSPARWTRSQTQAVPSRRGPRITTALHPNWRKTTR